MTSKLLAHKRFLSKLAKLSGKKRSQALKLATTSEIRCICECCANVLAGNIKLSKKQKIRLQRHKKVLRKLAKPRVTFATKKRVITQSGGSFLLALLPAAISAIASLVK